MKVIRALILICAAALAAPSLAQSWPQRPLRIVVALPPGTAPDLLARALAAALGPRLGQPVVVENRPGGGENIGIGAVAQADPDGHTLLFTATSVALNAHLYTRAHDPLAELAPVSQVANGYFILVARPSFPGKTLETALQYARSAPGGVTCAYVSGALRIACAWLVKRSGIPMTLVPYKGGPQALQDVVAGRVDLMFAPLNSALPLLGSGRLAGLAMTSPRRGLGPFPELPVMAETLAEFELPSWMGVMAPADTPREVIGELDREIGAMPAAPAMLRQIEAAGLEPAYAPSEAFGRVIRATHKRYGDVVRQTGIRPE
jgi:tripartite-type tricarboxylate transporter receptor subunit TctC